MSFKVSSEFNIFLNECYKLVLEDMRESGLIKMWDGKPTCLTPEYHFDNIVSWCKNNIKSHVWSCHDSNKCGFNTSYGAKHKCERELKCYVANNWMKLAMILSGLEVCTTSCVDFESGKVNPKPVEFQEILTNSINFICRRTKCYSVDNIQYKCIYPFEPDNLKYIG